VTSGDFLAKKCKKRSKKVEKTENQGELEKM
jgi:hypothetical protein